MGNRVRLLASDINFSRNIRWTPKLKLILNIQICSIANIWWGAQRVFLKMELNFAMNITDRNVRTLLFVPTYGLSLNICSLLLQGEISCARLINSLIATCFSCSWTVIFFFTVKKVTNCQLKRRPPPRSSKPYKSLLVDTIYFE